MSCIVCFTISDEEKKLNNTDNRLSRAELTNLVEQALTKKNFTALFVILFEREWFKFIQAKTCP